MRARLLIATTLAVNLLSPTAFAQDDAASRAELRQVLEQIRQELDAREAALEAAAAATPAQPGSLAAVQAKRDELTARADDLRARKEALAHREKAALAAVAGAVAEAAPAWPTMPGFEPPAPAAQPTAAPSVAQVETQEVPGAAVAPDADPARETSEEATATAAAEPQPVPADIPPLSTEDGLSERVLSRPGATLHAVPGEGDGEEIPVFSVLYVFGREVVDDEVWLNVGADPDEAPQGWVHGGSAEEWKNMLVMKYAPASERNRVLFFRNPEAILDIIEDFDAPTLAREQYERVQEGTYDPETLVAIEPSRSVDQSDRPYLMPILDWRAEEFDGGYETTLLQLAGLNLNAVETGDQETEDFLPGSFFVNEGATAEDLKIGVAFVIDTTRSMGPYLERAKRFVTSTYEELSRENLDDRFKFALVGYRDNTGPNPDIDYVTRIYRDLDAPADAETFRSQILDISVSTASTQNWREDALAGLSDAITQLRWDAVDAKLVFLITDASARDIGDPLARDPEMAVSTVADMAVQNNIALFMLHMQTEEAAEISQRTEGYNDHLRGFEQYARMQVTGNQIDTKYFRVRGASEDAFETALDGISRDLIATLKTFDQRELIAPVERGEDPFEAEAVDLLSQSPDGMEVDESSAGLISSAVVNEVFRAQQEYLGGREGVEAPAFYRAWAADRDLVDPRLKPFEVSVFMTRSQISDLARRLDQIVESLESKQAGLGEFFNSVRERSGKAVVDPQLGDFLPGYLDGLPYRSKFLNLSRARWEALGAGQEELLREVRGKIATYRQITSSNAGWLNLGGRTAEQQVYPMPLRNLP